MASFGPIAPFYDELMRSVPYRMWTGYYLLLLSQQGIKPSTILDVCCGTGVVTEMLHREGFEMSGMDLSAPMVDEARRKAAKKKFAIRYECQDAAEMNMGATYTAAYSFFDSLNYITDPSRLAMAIRRIGEHVRPGGSFIFDLNTDFAFAQQMFDQRQLHPRAKVRYDWKGHWDPIQRIIRVEMKFWRGDEEFYEEHVQRAHSDEEIRQMMSDAGFVDIKAYHSYTLDPMRRSSDRVHYTAIRSG